MKINKEKYIDSGLISERAHPTEPYLIYNYTPQCQFSKAWDEVTMQCRGLILHKDTGEVIARPFPKFFNYEEHIAKGMSVPSSKPVVYDKRDGSLGILYWGLDGTPYIATRGSFVSDQALWATSFFRKHGDFVDFNREYTYLFEIIYPENRIVIDYKGREGLDLLAIIETKTGKEIPMLSVTTPLGIPVRSIPFTDFEELKARNLKNSEGFVLHFVEDNLRLKIKFEEYVRLHKIMTGLSEIGLWEMLSEGKDLLQIIAEIPDEMHDWVKRVVSGLLERFIDIERVATQTEMEVEKLETRREQALIVMKSPYPGVVFSMLDKKNYKPIIWKMIRPRGSSTFRKDIDL